MGSDAAEALQSPQNSSCVKVHSSMCLELRSVLDKISCILPAIESARPGCMSGIQELCSLNNTVEKAKLLIQHCTESSKLYLAITGEAIMLRCERIKSALSQSLCQVQDMVPQLLAAQISGVLDFLRDAKFIIDSAEGEAGNAILELLGQTDSSEELEFRAFQIAAGRLNITSPKALLIERRSIRKLLEKIHGTDTKKERILNYFLHLIKRHGKKLRADIVEKKEDDSSHDKCLTPSKIFESNASKVESNDEPITHGEDRTNSSSTDAPPEEFCCPISSRLMYDPVVIASGQTFERVSIEKWFNEGHDTCPKTQKKLANRSVIPNSCMKDLIYSWCRKHGIDLEDPSASSVVWEPSRSISISSLKNVSAALLDGSNEDYTLQGDHSNVSILSSDASYCSDFSHVKDIDSVKEDHHAKLFPWSDDYIRSHLFSNLSQDMYLRFFYGLAELPLDLQDKAVQKLKILLESDDETCYAMLSNGFKEALIIFLKNAYNQSDMEAQKIGARIFLAFLSDKSVEIPSLCEEIFHFLTSFLQSEITEEALMILQKLSHHSNFKSSIAISGVPPSIAKILDCEDQELLELAVKIIYNLSSHSEIKCHILSSGCLPKLVTHLNNRRLAKLCVKIIRNLSDMKEAAVLITETNGSLSSIAELLETGCPEEKEHGVAILHVICSHSVDCCLLVMKEGVIPSLVDISVNGNTRGRESAMKLLHLLRDIRDSGSFDTSEPQSVSISELVVDDSIDHSIRKQPNSKSSGFFGRKMRFFSKPRSLALF